MGEKGWRPGGDCEDRNRGGMTVGEFLSSRKGEEAFGESWKHTGENGYVRVTGESSSAEDSRDTSSFGTTGG